MALNRKDINKQAGKSGPTRQLFTFFVDDMMFGLNVENVLMLVQNVSDIQRVPVEEQGFSGITKFQGIAVPVYDFANRVGIASGLETKQALLNDLIEYEKEHVEWVNSLENSLKYNVAFIHETNANQCAFGKWYKNFDTRDETLKELIEGFDEPHKIIHALADELITLKKTGKQADALERLKYERETSFRRLRALLSQAREQIQSRMRQVLLFVTLDGKTPHYALIIDEIHDVIRYAPEDLQSSSTGALALIPKMEDVLEGIYVSDTMPDCLFFDISKLTERDTEIKKVS